MTDLAVVIRRIRQCIGDATRTYETSRILQSRELLDASNNLERIKSNISEHTFNSLKNAIIGLLSLLENSLENIPNGAYLTERVKGTGRGRPKVSIAEGQIQMLYNERYSGTKMAKIFCCSKNVIYKKLSDMGLSIKQRYSNLSDDELKIIIKTLHEDHPNCGSEMMDEYLKSKGFFIQRKRIREVLNSIDLRGTALRWSRTIRRRSYKVPTPNALWHMDANLKLSRWGFVIHGCIDGYSRTIIYLSCKISIQAEPVLNLFVKSIQKYGCPSRVRSDHGYENILVAFLMNLIRGLERGSHITGKSVHNQRIERLWVDVYKEVLDRFYKELYSLEDENYLNADSILHRFCVQQTYLKSINNCLDSFKNAWNYHRTRTENKQSPRQLWLNGMLKNYNTDYIAIQELFFNEELQLTDSIKNALREYGADIENENIITLESTQDYSAFAARLDITEEEKMEVNHILSGVEKDKDKYIEIVNFLNNKYS